MIASEPVYALLGRAIDTAALRQAVYTANIANADVDGYRRLEVQTGAGTAPVSAEMNDSAFATGVEAMGPSRVVPAADAAVRLDQEMASMARNAVQYQALLGAFERMTSLLHTAARDGRDA